MRSLVFVALVACSDPITDTSTHRDVVPEPPRDTIVAPDDGSDAACVPAPFPGSTLRGAVSFQAAAGGQQWIDLALTKSGDALVLGLTYADDQDLDPTAASLLVGRDRTFLARIASDGTWLQTIVVAVGEKPVAVRVGDDGKVTIAGTLEGPQGVAIDLDPGPGTAAFPAGPQPLAFVSRFDADLVHEWSRAAHEGSFTVGDLTTRADGSVFVSGIGSGFLHVGQDYILGVGPGAFLWQLDANGLDVEVDPNVLEINTSNGGYGGRIAFGPDGSLALLGGLFGTYDLDGSPGLDIVTAVSYFGGTPASAGVVSIYEPDGSYRWSRRIPGGAEVSDMRLDSLGNIYVFGRLKNDYSVTLEAHDLDPTWGVDGHIGVSFVSRWNRDGTYGWSHSTDPYQGAWSDFAIDSDDNVLVLGAFKEPQILDPRTKSLAHTPPNGPTDIFVQSWSGVDGSFRWSQVIGAAAAENSGMLRAGPDGQYTITGTFAGDTDLDPSAATHPLASTGDGDFFVAHLSDGGEVAPFCPYTEPEVEPEPVNCRVTCESVGADCGIVPDGCGASMGCGACLAPLACGAVRPNVCGALTVLADGLNHGDQLRVDATHVYFTTFGDFGQLESIYPRSLAKVGATLSRVARTGGTPELLASGHYRIADFQLGSDAVYFVAHDPEEGTWLNPGEATKRHLLRVPLAGGPPEELLTPADAALMEYIPNDKELTCNDGFCSVCDHLECLTQPLRFLVDGSVVYYKGRFGMRLQTAPLAPPTQVTPTGCGPVVAFDATQLYFTCGPDAKDGLADTIVASGKNGQFPQVFVTNRRLLHPEYWIDGEYVVFRFGQPTTPPNPQAAINLVRVHRDARAATPEPYLQYAGLEPRAEGSFALTATTAFWTLTGLPEAHTNEGAILGRAAAGGPVDTIAGGLDHVSQLVLVGDALFWIERGGLGAHGSSGRVVMAR